MRTVPVVGWRIPSLYSGDSPQGRSEGHMPFPEEHPGSAEQMENIRKNRRGGMLPDTPGSVSSIITDLKWDGAQLDSRVEVRYGASVLEMRARKKGQGASTPPVLRNTGAQRMERAGHG